MSHATLKLYAMLGQYLPLGTARNEAQVSIDENETVGSLLSRMGVPEELSHLVLVNGVYIGPSDRAKTQINDTDAVAVWPPVAGG